MNNDHGVFDVPWLKLWALKIYVRQLFTNNIFETYEANKIFIFRKSN